MKNIKIYLNIYDFTPANNYLSHLGIGAYHTGVEINNKQYCFAVISTNPEQSGVIVIDPESAQYRFNRKVYLGQTKIKVEEYLRILQNLAKQFTCGSYHMFNNNCNHFSQQMVKRFVGVDIPKWVFRCTNIMKYLCVCLPKGLVSGRWAIQALQKQNADQFQDYLTNMS